MEENDYETQPLIEPDYDILTESQGPQQTKTKEEEGKMSIFSSGNNLKQKERSEIILEKAQQIAEREQEKRNLQKQREPLMKVIFRHTTFGDKCQIYIAYILALLSGALIPLQSIFYGLIVDELSQPEPNTSYILYVGVILLCIAVAVLVTITLYHYILEFQSFKITRQYKIEYLSALLKQDVGWYDGINTLELQSKMVSEIQQIQKMTGKTMGFILQAIGLFLFGFTYALMSSVYLTLILLAYFPIFAVLTMKMRRNLTIGVQETLKAYQRSAGFADQALNSIKVVSAFGQEETEVGNYQYFLEKAALHQYKNTPMVAMGFAFFASSIVLYFTYSFTFISTFVLLEIINPNTGEPYDPIDLWVITMILQMALAQFFFLFPNIKQLSEGQVAAKSAYKLLNKKPKFEIDDQSKKLLSKTTVTKGRIEFKNVDFSYKSVPILKNFSAIFEEGKTTAIVGKSGTGKSTIISLIERFYDIDSGELLIDNENIKDLNLKDYRNLIGYVGQEPVLFNTTIRKNLLYSNPEATDQEIIRALRLANAYKFIEKELKNEGINTNVGNAGTQLSGGQKQRIAIARALIKNPRILLLDEATSAMDTKNEQEVQEAIDRVAEVLGSITTIVVAHRLSTIRNADKILVMDEGQVVEEGSHDTLLRDYPNGIYSRMVKEQSNSYQIENQSEAENKKMTDQRKSFETESNSLQDVGAQKRVLNSYKFTEKSARLLQLAQRSLVAIVLIATIFLSFYYPIMANTQGNLLYALEGVYGLNDQKKIVILSLSIFLFLTIYVGIFRFIIKNSSEKIGVQVSKQVRTTLYTSILSKSMQWFDRRENAPGSLTSIMARDSTIIKSIGVESLAIVTEMFVTLIVSVIISSFYCWQIALTAFIFFPILLFSVSYVNIMQKKVELAVNAQAEEASLLSGDLILNYRTVASLSNQEYMIKEYDKYIVHQSSEIKSSLFAAAFSVALLRFTIIAIYSIVMIYVAILLEQNQELDGDTVFKSVMILFVSFIVVGSQTQFVGDLAEASISSDRIFSVIDEPSAINPLKEDQNPINYRTGKIPKIKSIQGIIEFKNVWFAYPNRNDVWVLCNFSLKIEQNSSIALVGESGCGKSTIVQLLLRFYEVNQGVILLDGVDIKDYPIGDLRRYMGLVMQEPSLFTYSLYENILYGNGTASNSQILEASRKAYVLEFIDRFKDENDISHIGESYTLLREEFENIKPYVLAKLGQKEYNLLLNEISTLEQQQIEQQGKIEDLEGVMDFREEQKKDIDLQPGFYKGCGLKGNRLSGGQKQRVAIARALIRNPKILLLDEATSSLDEESQSIVQKAINELMGERTAIVIAHRLSTVEKCQRIVMICKGRVVEQGTIEELKSNPNSYYNYFARETRDSK